MPISVYVWSDHVDLGARLQPGQEGSLLWGEVRVERRLESVRLREA